jgi:hypothetical protein
MPAFSPSTQRGISEPTDVPLPTPGATRMLYSMYPSQVRHWIANRGGLSPRMIFLRGRQLEAMYGPCYLDARVAVPR